MKIAFIHMNILLSHAQGYLLLLTETFPHLVQTFREVQETLRHMNVMLPQVNQTSRHLDQTLCHLYFLLCHLIRKKIHKQETHALITDFISQKNLHDRDIGEIRYWPVPKNTKQLKRYAESPRFQGKENLKKALLIFRGRDECFVYEV